MLFITKMCVYATMFFQNETFSEPCSTLPPPCENEYNMYWELVSQPEGSEQFLVGEEGEYVFTKDGMYVFEYVALIFDEGNTWSGTMVTDTILVGFPPDLYVDTYTICRGDVFHPLPDTEIYDGYVWDTLPQRSTVYRVITKNEYCSDIEDFNVNVIQCEQKDGYVSSENNLECNGVYIPNAFSPNGDGVNDVYRVLLPPNAQITNFAVYDRWGRHVTSEHPWVADTVSAGTYAVLIEIDACGDTHSFVQSVILIR
jgi:hypothetical protein